MPETRIPGKMYPSGHANEAVHAVMEVVEAWFLAIEDGTAQYHLPDLEYRRSGGRDQWTEKELDVLVRDLDKEVEQEVGRAPGTSTGSTAGPGFVRLNTAQRLALAQELDRVVAKYERSFPVAAGVT